MVYSRIQCAGFRERFAFGCLLMSLSFSQAGCSHETSTAADTAPPPKVGVARPIVREIVDVAEFTGRTEAPYSVDIRARVTGYLVKMPFVEGSEVKKGELLFEVDPRPFQAAFDQATSDVALNKAKLKLAQADNARAKNIAKMNAGAVSQQDLETKQANEEEAAAAVESSRANLESADINLKFTRVNSPIDGRVGRYNLTIGNLVNADSTVLTTVVSEDPMYGYFTVDEPTMLSVVRRLMDSNVDPMRSKNFDVFMALEDEEGYPHKGYINFVNNVVNNSTGTLTIRGVFANPPGKFDRRLLRPGMFVRIRLPISPLHTAILVAEKAIGSDQDRKFLYVVDDKNVVEYREITTGPPQDDGLRVVATGLKADERVIISGLQLVRPKMTVLPEDEPMIAPRKSGTSKATAGVRAGTKAGSKSTQPAAIPRGPATKSQIEKK